MSPSLAAFFLSWTLSGHDFPLLQQDEDQRCLRLRGPEDVGEIVQRIERYSLTPAERAEVARQIARLSVSEYRTRQRAQKALQAMRPGAAVLLRHALTEDDLEQQRRIQMCLEHMPPRWSAAQAEAAVRLLRVYRPERVGPILWEYLACAEDACVEREICSALRDLREQGLFTLDAVSATSAVQERCAAFLQRSGAEDVSPTSQALHEARAFFRMLAQGDVEMLEQRCQLPFCLGNDLVVKSRAELKDLLGQIAANYRGYAKNFSLKMEFARRGETYSAYAAEGEQRFLESLGRGEVRAVHVRARYNVHEEETGAVLIVLRADGPRIVGLGHAGPKRR